MLEARTERATQVTDYTFTRGLFDVTVGRMIQLEKPIKINSTQSNKVFNLTKP